MDCGSRPPKIVPIALETVPTGGSANKKSDILSLFIPELLSIALKSHADLITAQPLPFYLTPLHRVSPPLTICKTQQRKKNYLALCIRCKKVVG